MTTTQTFSTEYLPFAAFLLTTNRLKFLQVEQQASGDRLSFVFNDPAGEGDSLKVAFECGAECSAISFFEALKRLRKIMDASQRPSETKGALKNGNRSR